MLVPDVDMEEIVPEIRGKTRNSTFETRIKSESMNFECLKKNHCSLIRISVFDFRISHLFRLHPLLYLLYFLRLLYLFRCKNAFLGALILRIQIQCAEE